MRFDCQYTFSGTLFHFANGDWFLESVHILLEFEFFRHRKHLSVLWLFEPECPPRLFLIFPFAGPHIEVSNFHIFHEDVSFQRQHFSIFPFPPLMRQFGVVAQSFPDKSSRSCLVSNSTFSTSSVRFLSDI